MLRAGQTACCGRLSVPRWPARPASSVPSLGAPPPTCVDWRPPPAGSLTPQHWRPAGPPTTRISRLPRSCRPRPVVEKRSRRRIPKRRRHGESNLMTLRTQTKEYRDVAMEIPRSPGWMGFRRCARTGPSRSTWLRVLLRNSSLRAGSDDLTAVWRHLPPSVSQSVSRLLSMSSSSRSHSIRPNLCCRRMPPPASKQGLRRYLMRRRARQSVRHNGKGRKAETAGDFHY